MRDQDGHVSGEEFPIVRPAALSDTPVQRLRDDALGFTPYVRTLVEFVRHPETTTPLSISIEGKWGTGKSTFLNFLAEQLQREGDWVVRFDAWRHEKSESLLSDFALELIRQLRGRVGFTKRVAGSSRLALSRIMWYEALPLAALGLALLALTVLLASVILHTPALAKTGVDEELVRAGSVGAYFAAVALGLKKATELVGHPKISVGNYRSVPGYREHAAFTEQAVRDIERIVRAWAPQRRVYVLIDDVDRCSPSGIGQLMQALNVVTSTRARNLVFFVGMDRAMVAAALASDMAARVAYISRTASPALTQADAALVLAYEYLDKFVALPFRVPALEKQDTYQFLVDVNLPPGDPRANRKLRRLDEPRTATDSQELRNAVEQLAFVFAGDPRGLKRFINVLRISAILLKYISSPGAGQPNLLQLSKFVAMSLHCPLIVDDLQGDPNLLASLESLALRKIDADDVSEVAKAWAADRTLMEIVRLDPEGAGSMQDVSVAGLMWASRARIRPSDFFTETGSRAYWNKTTRRLFR